MKKNIALLCAGLLIVFGCLALAGCSNNAEPSKQEDTGLTEVDFKNGGFAGYIEKVLSVTLDENATTGYTWAYDISDSSILALTDDDYFGPESKDGKVGEGGVRIFSFEGKKAGTTKVTFTLGQNWDGGETSKDDTITIEVTVGEGGKISEVVER